MATGRRGRCNGNAGNCACAALPCACYATLLVQYLPVAEPFTPWSCIKPRLPSREQQQRMWVSSSCCNPL
jgi:hypothetical protein